MTLCVVYIVTIPPTCHCNIMIVVLVAAFYHVQAIIMNHSSQNSFKSPLALAAMSSPAPTGHACNSRSRFQPPNAAMATANGWRGN